MNSEGYKDPTAEKAIHNAGYLPEHIWEPLKLIRRLLDIVGLELIGITVRDRRSKRKYTWGGGTVEEGNYRTVHRCVRSCEGNGKRNHPVEKETENNRADKCFRK